MCGMTHISSRSEPINSCEDVLQGKKPRTSCGNVTIHHMVAISTVKERRSKFFKLASISQRFSRMHMNMSKVAKRREESQREMKCPYKLFKKLKCLIVRALILSDPSLPHSQMSIFWYVWTMCQNGLRQLLPQKPIARRWSSSSRKHIHPI